MRKNFVYFLFFTLLVCSNCVTTVKIPVVESAPSNFFATMKGTRTIGIFVDDAPNTSIDDWKNTIHAGIEHALNDFNYFKIIDIKNRSQRLKEIGFAQQIGNDMRNLGTELSIQGLLYVEISEPPRYDCKLSTRSRSEKYCAARNKEGKCIREATRTIVSYEQTLTYTVFAKARLINIVSGQSLTAANSEPAILTNSGGTPMTPCPSIAEGYSKGIQVASNTIVTTLSPKVRPYSIPLFSSTIGVKNSLKAKTVEAYLESGNAWMESTSPNFELAKKDWDQALTNSGQSSVDAFWNLGIYYWQAGDIIKAEEYFTKCISIGGPKVLDSTWENLRLIFRNKRRDVINKFYEEKKRFELENTNS
jgi:tetratricopeptide (TPR) repeat protein